jgi:hypothetical protein
MRRLAIEMHCTRTHKFFIDQHQGYFTEMRINISKVRLVKSIGGLIANSCWSCHFYFLSFLNQSLWLFEKVTFKILNEHYWLHISGLLTQLLKVYFTGNKTILFKQIALVAYMTLSIFPCCYVCIPYCRPTEHAPINRYQRHFIR